MKTEERNLSLSCPMSKTVFNFKKFQLKQEKSAMKIGTDGVLLGAWATANNPDKILDIGTGTGLIVMMLAQRFPNADLVGLDINATAVEEAKENCARSPFHNNRCTIVHQSIQNFQPKNEFDLIVCNPPYLKIHTKYQLERLQDNSIPSILKN